MLAFVSDIFPDCATDECNKEREAKMEESKVKAKVTDRLLYRHWTTWKEGRRTHVFVVSSDGGAARDMTPGDYDAPPFSLGGPPDYAFSPDSKELAFARNTDKVEATSTNGDIFIVPVAGGEAKRITESNRGADLSPQYSPDGRYIAYRSQERAGFESDRWRLMLYDRQANQSRELIQNFDAYVDTFMRSRPTPNISTSLSGERGRQPVYYGRCRGRLAAVKILQGFNDDVEDLRRRQDDGLLALDRDMADRDLHTTIADPRTAPGESAVRKLTKTNDALLANSTCRRAEEDDLDGRGGRAGSRLALQARAMHGQEQVPARLCLIHGGPQGAWNDSWGYRWNPQVFAARATSCSRRTRAARSATARSSSTRFPAIGAARSYTDIINGVDQVIKKPSWTSAHRRGGRLATAATWSTGSKAITTTRASNSSPSLARWRLST